MSHADRGSSGEKRSEEFLEASEEGELDFPSETHFPVIFGRAGDETKRFARGWRAAHQSRRIMSKKGRLNIFLRKVPNKHLKYIRDIGHMLLTIQWRWILLAICVANAVAYFLFAGIWMTLAWMHGDMEKNPTENNGTLCVFGTNKFVGYLLLSIETLTTIGFGIYYPTENCPQGWVILTLQALTNLAIDGILVSAVYVKIARPYTKDSRRLFSKKAVIYLRDGKLCLVFRVCDKTGKHRAKTKIRAYFVRKKVSEEGEHLPNYISKLALQPQGLLIWPLEVVHVIDENSPLWGLSAGDLLSVRFEILAVIGGNSIITGQPCQSQTSYLSQEILWGQRFVNCVDFDIQKTCYRVDYQLFNKTTQFDSPLCSAERLQEIQGDLEKRNFSEEKAQAPEIRLETPSDVFEDALEVSGENFMDSDYENVDYD